MNTLTPTPTPRTDEWEAYCDECYYHLWRLRRKTERGWNDGFHIHTGEEAKGLCDLLNNLEAELTAVTEQRDRLAVQLEALSKPADFIHNGVGIADLYAPGEFEKVENQTSV